MVPILVFDIEKGTSYRIAGFNGNDLMSLLFNIQEYYFKNYKKKIIARMKITQNQIDELYQFTRKHFVYHYDVQTELVDRFGPLPNAVNDLFMTIRCRRIAISLGFEKMTLKEQTLRCYFINNPDSPYFESPVFQGIMQFVQTSLNKAQLKQTGKLFLLVVRDMEGMEALLRLLTRMHAAVVEKPVAA